MTLDNRSTVLIVMGVVILALSAVAFYAVFARIQYQRAVRSMAGAQQADAQIVSRRSAPIGRRMAHYVTYRFIARAAQEGATSVTAEAKVRTAEFERLPEGVHIPVDYLPSDPRIARLSQPCV